MNLNSEEPSKFSNTNFKSFAIYIQLENSNQGTLKQDTLPGCVVCSFITSSGQNHTK